MSKTQRTLIFIIVCSRSPLVGVVRTLLSRSFGLEVFTWVCCVVGSGDSPFSSSAGRTDVFLQHLKKNCYNLILHVDDERCWGNLYSWMVIHISRIVSKNLLALIQTNIDIFRIKIFTYAQERMISVEPFSKLGNSSFSCAQSVSCHTGNFRYDSKSFDIEFEDKQKSMFLWYLYIFWQICEQQSLHNHEWVDRLDLLIELPLMIYLLRLNFMT